MESSNHLQHLFSDVPFHEIAGKDVSEMNDKELEAFILTTRASRVAPSERRKSRSTNAKVLSGKKKTSTEQITDLTHLI